MLTSLNHWLNLSMSNQPICLPHRQRLQGCPHTSLDTLSPSRSCIAASAERCCLQHWRRPSQRWWSCYDFVPSHGTYSCCQKKRPPPPSRHGSVFHHSYIYAVTQDPPHVELNLLEEVAGFCGAILCPAPLNVGGMVHSNPVMPPLPQIPDPHPARVVIQPPTLSSSDS